MFKIKLLKSFAFIFLFMFTGLLSFTLTIKKGSSIGDTPVSVKVEVDGIPRTIGPNFFQNISGSPIETTLLNQTTVKITAKVGSQTIEKEIKPSAAQILTIKESSGSYVIE